MNLSLLIADDEEVERRALRMQIERAFPELTMLRPAANGLELIDAVRAHRPDIVMADIEMPGMNGLAALEQLRAEGIKPNIIIMTAYSSEHYLKESLSLRVFEYLEKPLRRSRVEQSLRALIGELEAEHNRDAELAQMRETVRSMHRMIRSELMTNIESDEADPNQTAELLDMLEMDSRRFLVMTFSLTDADGESQSVYGKRIAELNIFERLREVVRARDWVDGHVINHRMSCLVPVMLKVDGDDDYRIREAACCEADEVLKALGLQSGIRVGIGVSTTEPQCIQKSRQQSVQALYRQDKHATICHYEDQPVPAGIENLFVSEEVALLEYIQTGNAAQAERCIHACFASLPEWIPFESLRSQAFELLLALNRRSRIQLFEDLLNHVSTEMHRCADRDELEAYVVQVCLDCIRRIHKDDSRWQEDIIEKAKRYIDACYNTDISLEGTAEAIGVSRFYLSRLFKTRLGMNYSTYLTERRVQMAALLMKSQKELTNREIAERVGFRDPDYFGKVFKKQIGCTVSEYREK